MANEVRIIRDNSAALVAAIENAVARAVEAEVEDVTEDAKQRAPVLSGRHKAGIRGEMTGKLSGEVSTDPALDYPVHLEYGTSRMAPRPAITPAAEAARLRFTGRVAASVKAVTGKK
jgi:hypothetical protein